MIRNIFKKGNNIKQANNKQTAAINDTISYIIGYVILRLCLRSFGLTM